jgi:hypothetical protein
MTDSSPAGLCQCLVSIGITMLELISNSSMPSRGADWQLIRSGTRDATEYQMCSCVHFSFGATGTIPEHLLQSSPAALSDLIGRMLSPDPADRSVGS